MSRKKESDLVSQLKDYFENTPEEVLKRELEELEPYNQIGPDVETYFKGLAKKKRKTVKK